MNLYENNPLAADGDYDASGLARGKEYLLTARGDFGGGTLKLQAPIGVSGAFEDVEDGEWTAAFEARFIAPAATVRLNLDGGTAPEIQITLTPLL